MKKKDFLVDVMAEIDNIKQKATPQEISRLNFTTFNHESAVKCIYGQMTGDCFCARAKELTPKSYEEVFGHGYKFREQDYTKGDVFTALEKYLFMVKAPMHKKIIAYLKGETDTLILK